MTEIVRDTETEIKTDTEQNYYMFVGQANRDIPYVKEVSGCGISVYTFDESTAEVEFLVDRYNSDNPTYLTYSDKDNMLFVTNEVAEWPEGEVAGYMFSPTHKHFGYMNKQVVFGNMTAYVAMDSKDKNVLVANYGVSEDPEYSGGSAAVLPRDGHHLLPMTGRHSFEGSGPNKDRQGGSHPHCIIASADNRFVIIADLGLDMLSVHAFDEEAGKISKDPAYVYRSAPGAGPRQVVKNVAGDKLYLLNELDGTASALNFNTETGEISLINTISTLAEDYAGERLSADIQLHPNGEFLYASNRVCNTISTISIEAETGAIALLKEQPCGGETPRSFCIDPTGAFMVVANQDSNSVNFFDINSQTGELTAKNKPLAVGSPTCVKICLVTPLDKV